jgi:Ca2+-binding EF-hand superfamily protein
MSFCILQAVDDKIEFLYRMMDYDEDGKISRSDLDRIAALLSVHGRKYHDFLDTLFLRFRRNELSLDDFKTDEQVRDFVAKQFVFN